MNASVLGCHPSGKAVDVGRLELGGFPGTVAEVVPDAGDAVLEVGDLVLEEVIEQEADGKLAIGLATRLRLA